MSNPISFKNMESGREVTDVCEAWMYGYRKGIEDAMYALDAASVCRDRSVLTLLTSIKGELLRFLNSRTGGVK